MPLLLQSNNSLMAQVMAVQMCVLILSAIKNPVDASAATKLEESSIPGARGIENKCLTCSPCENPCTQNQPPPPPPPPPKDIGMRYCPPPPFVYIGGLTGGMYPLDPYYSGGYQICTRGLHVWLVPLLMGLLVFWRL